MTPNLRSNNRSLLAPTRRSGLLQAGLMVGLVLVLAWLVMISGPSESSAAPVSQARPLLLVAPPGSTATPTPFQPLPPTPTYQPTDFVYPTPTPLPFTPQAAPVTGGQSKTWADYPGPIIWPDVQVPPPVGILPQPEGQVNILLLGFLFAVGALGFDAIKSFFKRQIGVKPGGVWFPFDQIDYIVGGLLLSALVVDIPHSSYYWIGLIWFLIQPVSTFVGWLVGLKDSPI